MGKFSPESLEKPPLTNVHDKNIYRLVFTLNFGLYLPGTANLMREGGSAESVWQGGAKAMGPAGKMCDDA
jgi:hypothetical protein